MNKNLIGLIILGLFSSVFLYYGLDSLIYNIVSNNACSDVTYICYECQVVNFMAIILGLFGLILVEVILLVK